MWSSLNEWLWQDRFWLPPNNSWTELEDREGLVFAHPQDMLVALPLALALVAIRFTFERFVGLPLSRWLGVQDQARKLVKPNATLEKHFLMEGWRPNKPQIAVLATQCGLTLRQTQCWFRRRRNQDRPCLTKKFCEARWRKTFAVTWRSQPQVKRRKPRSSPSSRMGQLKSPRNPPLMALGAGQLGGWPMGTCWPHSWLVTGCEGLPLVPRVCGVARLAALGPALWRQGRPHPRVGGADDLSPALFFCLPSHLPLGH
uniref:sphingosine N-acyltransferase n=1 Tax=Molossus molossus TaxID=27622 RepID=A0A7J8I5T4_MOLMO|nr:ceramide synthase 4 [Molossus molossus]